MSTSIFFEPWIGKHYGTPEARYSKRILVLGGSHYCEGCDECGDRKKKPECSGLTRAVIRDYLDPDHSASWKKTFTTFINSLTDSDSSDDERTNVMDSIAFYNYLQVAAGEDAYSADQYDYGHPRHLDAFYEVLDTISPDVVICWGSKVWDALPDNWRDQGDATKGTGISVCGRTFLKYQNYPYDRKQIMLIGIRHPSVGYDRDFHHKLFAQLILQDD